MVNFSFLHPCINNHPNRVSNYRQNFSELKIDEFDFTNGFKCSDVHKFEKLDTLSIKLFELNFYQDQNKWKQKLILIEASKNDSNRVVDSIIHKNHYALIKKLNVIVRDHQESFTCRRCFNSYTSENTIMLHKLKCREDGICSFRTSNESHLYWQKHFHKNPLYFRRYADFETDYETDNSSVGKKTTEIYKENPILNG